jgi:hypothetical protein
MYQNCNTHAPAALFAGSEMANKLVSACSFGD